jgi:preprotein translocase subunit SecD
MRLSATDVESASAHKIRIGQWVVKMHLSAEGVAAFDRIAPENFHEFLAIDIGGKVVSTPLVQPNQASFSSL